MNKEELRKHLYELSNSEKKYLDNPTLILSDFYVRLKEMGMEDENGIFIMPESLIATRNVKVKNNNSSSVWERFENSVHQDQFILNKASRFYREPFMSGDIIAIRYVYSGECIIYTPRKKSS